MFASRNLFEILHFIQWLPFNKQNAELNFSATHNFSIVSSGLQSPSGGLAKNSERIILQHSYHVTFFRNTVRNASEMHPKFSKVSKLYPKCIPNNSCIPVECILPALYHTLGGLGKGRGSVQGVSIQEVSIIQ